MTSDITHGIAIVTYDGNYGSYRPLESPQLRGNFGSMMDCANDMRRRNGKCYGVFVLATDEIVHETSPYYRNLNLKIERTPVNTQAETQRDATHEIDEDTVTHLYGLLTLCKGQDEIRLLAKLMRSILLIPTASVKAIRIILNDTLSIDFTTNAVDHLALSLTDLRRDQYESWVNR